LQFRLLRLSLLVVEVPPARLLRRALKGTTVFFRALHQQAAVVAAAVVVKVVPLGVPVVAAVVRAALVAQHLLAVKVLQEATQTLSEAVVAAAPVKQETQTVRATAAMV
jgi:hypothetical protein